MKRIALVGIVSALMSSGVLAAGNGGFFEAGLGSSKFSVDGSSGWSMDEKDTSFSAVGGYMFNENVGVEGGYLDLGEVSGSITGNLSGNLYGKLLTVNGTVRANGDAKGWLLGVRGVLPINKQFSLNGRVGAFVWDSDVTVNVSAVGTWGGAAIAANGTASQSYSGSDIYYGIGANYAIDKNIAIGVGYSHYTMKKLDAKASNLDIKWNYRF